jgi:hypothetical protein
MGTFVRQHPVWTAGLILLLVIVFGLLWLGVGPELGPDSEGGVVTTP